MGKGNRRILKLKNEFVDLPLRNFSAREIDILHAICYKCQDKWDKPVELSFKELKELSGYRGKDKKILINKICAANEKLIFIFSRYEDDRKIIHTNMFNVFEIDKEYGFLEVSVNTKYMELLNRFKEGYTTLDMDHILTLKSVYSKQIYKKLRKYKNRKNAFWNVSINEFREFLDIPSTFRITNIDDRIIKPSIKVLSPFFKDLKCEKVYGINDKKKSILSGYKFSYKGKEEPQGINELDLLASKTGWEKLGNYCPKCGQEVYKKPMKNKYGEYFLIGHPDFKTGSCSWSTTNFTDTICGKKIEYSYTELTEEEKEENRQLVNHLINNIFLNMNTEKN